MSATPNRLARVLVSGSMAVLVAAGCASDEADAGEVLESYTTAINAHDLDRAMSFFAENAVISGYPTRTADLVGLDPIRDAEAGVLTFAAREDASRWTDVIVKGNTVSFGHVFLTRSGECFSGEGHTVSVDGGKIVTWDWGTHSQPCPSVIPPVWAYQP